MEFDFSQVVENVRNGMRGDSVILVGKAAERNPAIHAVTVSFSMTSAGVGINIEVNDKAVRAMRQIFPDDAYDEWCSETVSQISASAWFKARCEKLNDIVCRAMESEGGRHGSV